MECLPEAPPDLWGRRTAIIDSAPVERLIKEFVLLKVQLFSIMKGKPFLVLAFAGCCSLQLAAQGNHVMPSIKKDSVCSYVRMPLKADAGIFKVKPVALHTVYYNHLGFMCRQELKLEKATKTSFRIRLGSVEYTDRMEGKRKPVTLH
ncbi:hypothetical protein [Niabella aurantiaca]|uniref:hypothetical protein n=1 Tax=Niabella aurantiaca TaxID=379900 RepID=UPI0012FA77A7|nr:hypothetical protein [Niabella aurantiaca]